MPRYIIHAEREFGPLTSKTGNAILRYRPHEAVAVVDSARAGESARSVLGYGGDVPVVASLAAALALGGDTLLLGGAPVGGRLTRDRRAALMEGLRGGLHVVSGLHTRLADDPELAAEAAARGTTITDLRYCPPERQVVHRARWRQRTTPTVLSVGTDCNVGKMTALLGLQHALAERGVRSVFVGTGQTGILISGRGVAVDALVSDFVSGTIEAEVERAIAEHAPDVVLVEGQGALTHPGYSGVTLGLMHGVMPDALLMVHQPTRTHDGFGLPIAPLPGLLRLHEQLVAPFRPCRTVGVALNDLGLDAAACAREEARISEETGLPTSATTRSGAAGIADHLMSILQPRAAA